jgi:hypothetical protein
MTHSTEQASEASRRWAWLKHPLFITLVTIAGTLLVQEIAASAGHVYFVAGPRPSVTKTVTDQARPAPTITKTATVSPAPTGIGPISLPDCNGNDGCNAYNIKVSLGEVGAGITFATGTVTPGTVTDVFYSLNSANEPELSFDETSNVYSVVNSSSDANEAGCVNLTNSGAVATPLEGLHKGLTFCVHVIGDPCAVPEPAHWL